MSLYNQRLIEYSNTLTQTLRFNIPEISSIYPVEHYASAIGISSVLSGLENSLNIDRYEFINNSITPDKIRGYVSIVTETAISDIFNKLERVLCDDVNDVNIVNVDDVAYHVMDTSGTFEKTLTEFTFVVVTSVISNIMIFVKNMCEVYHLDVNTFKFIRSPSNNTTLDVVCYLNKIPNIK